MTVSSTTSRVTYAGDGVSVAFPVSFYFLANADLVVLLVDSDDVSTTQVLTTNYTVTGAGVLAGGTVTMLVAPPSGYTLVIYRDPAVTQLVDYQPNDPFPADTHERALDKLTMIALRLKELVTRSMRLADSDTSGADTTLPTPEPLKVLGWNNAGDALVNTDASTLASVVAAGNPIYEYFNGDGVTVDFSVSSSTLGSLPATKVFLGGVRQSPGFDYTVSGATVTFTTAPVAGTDNILVEWTDAIAAVGVPSDGSVTLGKLQDGLFTVSAAALLKFADGFFSATAGARAKFADGFLTLGKLATNIFSGATTATIVSSDKVVFSDASDSGNTKIGLVSDIVTLASGKTTGDTVQVAHSQTGTVATGTTTIPADNTIPQNTEGTQFLTASITPTSATNKLLIEVIATFCSTAASGRIAMALFQDSVANALASQATFTDNAAGNAERILVLRHEMTAGSTSNIDFKVRAGPSAAATITLNGNAGAGIFNGTYASSIRITEVKV